MYLPTIYHLIFSITNNRPIIKAAIELEIFNNQQLYLINLVRIKLQVIFISDLLITNLNQIKECYLKGRRDHFIKSNFMWPQAEPNNQAIKLWERLMRMIALSTRCLHSPINTSILVLSH